MSLQPFAPVVAGLPASELQGVTSTSFRHSRAALARSRNGGSPFRIQFYGDSIINGTGMTTGQTQSYPERFRAITAARSLGAGDIVGEGLIWLDNNDTRITPGTWVPVGAGPGSTGCLIGNTGTSMSVALPSCDHVNVYFPNYGGGVGTANLDGGAATTFNCAAGAPVGQFTTLTGTTGTHTLNLGVNSGANVAVFAVEYFTAASATTIRTSRTGSVGSTAANWAVAGGVNSLPASNGVVVPDLVILGLGTNDIQQGEAVALFTADMQLVISQLQTTATDIILVSPYYSTFALAGPLGSAVVNSIANLAAANNCALWNQTSLWTSFAAATADGLMGADTVHPSIQGNFSLAQSLWNALAVAGVL